MTGPFYHWEHPPIGTSHGKKVQEKKKLICQPGNHFNSRHIKGPKNSLANCFEINQQTKLYHPLKIKEDKESSG